MKKLIIGMALLASTSASYADLRATVISVRPLTSEVYAPVQNCRIENVQVAPNTTANGIFGAIAGGVIGNQIGQGTGNTVATAIGAVVGHEMATQNSQPRIEQRQICDTIYEKRTVANGYDVTFSYGAGNDTFSQVMSYEPRIGSVILFKITAK